MKKKNIDLGRWYSGIRSPYERVFSKQNKRVRYLGIEKNQFSAFIKNFYLKSCLQQAPNLQLITLQLKNIDRN